MPILALNDVSKRFGSHQALDGVSLAVESGEVVAIHPARAARQGGGIRLKPPLPLRERPAHRAG